MTRQLRITTFEMPPNVRFIDSFTSCCVASRQFFPKKLKIAPGAGGGGGGGGEDRTEKLESGRMVLWKPFLLGIDTLHLTPISL